MCTYELSNAYLVGRDVNAKVVHHILAALGGQEKARHNLGLIEENTGMDRAITHFMIAARSGNDGSLKKVREGYEAGHVTKEEYACILRAHKASKDEMKSEQRTKTITSDFDYDMSTFCCILSG